MIYDVVDRETISDVSDAIGFTSNKLVARNSYAIIQAVDGDIRFTLDGTTPTASLGLRLTEDSSVEVWGQASMKAFKCIDDGGTADLEVIYMGRAAA